MTQRLLVGVVVLALASILSAQSKSPIQGVWKVAETVGGQGAATPTSVNSTPQPGYYIFTGTHYSITRVYGDKPRMAPKETNTPTIEELADANRFVAQFGTYEIKGDTIAMRALVARSPATMNAATAPGAAPVTGTFKLDGKTLTLTTKNVSGQTAVVKMTRVE